MSLAIFFIVVIIALVVPIKQKSRPSKDYTEWEYWRNGMPYITIMPNGEKRFQHQEYWTRFNNVTQKWESKKVINPELLRFEEATDLEDIYHLRYH